MNFKEFFGIPTRSQEPELQNALEKQTAKSPHKYEQLIGESVNLDTQRRMIAVLNQILNELDPEKNQETTLDLEYIIRLYQEWADLNQEILSNLKIVDKSELVEEQLEEGDLEPKNELFRESNESMQSRIDEIHAELDTELHSFENNHPKIFDRFFELAKQSQENRTN